MITHQNLAHNESIITRELKADVSTVCVSWLPQYHDMGLIGSYLGTIYCGGSGFYLSPISFLKDPTIWLYSMSKYKATHTQAPNFAFALATRKFKASNRSAALNLSSLRHMINAAEPVDAVAIENFYSVFGSHGLPRDVVVPTYGLAEHTVFVCSGGKQQVIVKKEALESGVVEIVSSEGHSFVSSISGEAKLAEQGYQCIVGCGYPKADDAVDLIIVQPESLAILCEDKVGEIWVSSPSKARGYWNNPQLTAEDFNATPSGGSISSSGYLKTGDLGFLHAGFFLIFNFLIN